MPFSSSCVESFHFSFSSANQHMYATITEIRARDATRRTETMSSSLNGIVPNIAGGNQVSAHVLSKE